MKTTHCYFVLTAAGLLFMAQPASAVNAYLSISNNSGPIETDQKNDWVPVYGFGHGGENSVNIGSISSGGGAGIMSQKLCTLQLGHDQSIAKLFDAVQTGSFLDLKIQLIELNGDSSANRVTTQVEFLNCALQDVTGSANDGGGLVEFNVEFQYSEIRWIITQVADDGQPLSAMGTGYDVVKNLLIDIGDTSVPEAFDLSNDGGGTPSSDTDSDKIPNTWETTYQLDPNDPADATNDPDGDGFSNLEEYLTGTNPRQANSYFRMTIQGSGSARQGAVVLNWNSVPGKSYTLRTGESLSAPFTILTNITAGAGNETSYTNSTGSGQYFKVEL